jgi:hypothetical protein
MTTETYTEVEMREMKKMLRFIVIVIVAFLLLFTLFVANANAVRVSIIEEFTEGGASFIIQPTWENHTEEEEESQQPLYDEEVIVGAFGRGLIKWTEDNWFIVGVFIVGCALLIVSKKWKRQARILEKGILRRDKDEHETEGKDTVGKVKIESKRRTTVPGRKGIYRRYVE